MGLIDNWHALEARIAAAAIRAGRPPESVGVLAVTKTHAFEAIAPLLQEKILGVGENRVQEALQKYLAPDGARRVPVPLHLIGPLQSNKAKKAVGLFDLIQTLDRFDLAEDLNRHASEAGKVQDCLIQVKISMEATKSGLDPVRLPEFLESLKALKHLRIRGLMGIPPLSAVGDAARPYFERLRRLFEEFKKSSPPRTVIGGPRESLGAVGSPLTIRGDDNMFSILSMGMSSDFEAAIAEGATLLRLGTVLFGSRPRIEPPSANPL